MTLRHLSLINFKNYPALEIGFGEGINCITGPNGVGKTNLLDAVYYLALTRSYFNPVDKQVIRHGEKMMMVKGIFAVEGKEEVISCGLQAGQKKRVKRNRKEYSRISDHIGLIPVVIITPFDAFLVLEGSEVRRKFIDGIISQEDPAYLRGLLDYNRALMQRNLLIKHFAREHTFDSAALEIWDMKLVALGEEIHRKRLKFIGQFLPVFDEFYRIIGGGTETAVAEYRSTLSEGDFARQLRDTVQDDLIRQFTTRGIHKDDLIFSVNGYPLKKFGSQGQQKTFLLALKLAQFRQMKTRMEKIPILLLDDIYDKLDSARMKQLMELVAGEGFGQILITDTHPTRVRDIFAALNTDVKTIEIQKEAQTHG